MCEVFVKGLSMVLRVICSRDRLVSRIKSARRRDERAVGVRWLETHHVCWCLARDRKQSQELDCYNEPAHSRGKDTE